WLNAVLLIGLSGAAVSGVLWVLCYWLWQPAFLRGITSILAALIFPAIPLTVAFTYLLALLTGAERFAARAGIALLSQVSELAGIVVLIVWLGKRVEVALAGNLLGMFLAVSLGARLLKTQFPSPMQPLLSRAEIKAALQLGARGLGNLASFLSYRL